MRNLKRFSATAVLVIVAIVALRNISFWHIPQALQFPAEETDRSGCAFNRGWRRVKASWRSSFGQGYLQSVLIELEIPVSSQALVYSRTSVQIDRISLSTPRAQYFNDDVYVAWIPESPVIEIASIDPRYGLVFYALSQDNTKPPEFQSLGVPCTSCHAPAREDVPAPLLLMMSVNTNPSGQVLGPIRATTDRDISVNG
jgi:hypothetical protein